MRSRAPAFLLNRTVTGANMTTKMTVGMKMLLTQIHIVDKLQADLWAKSKGELRKNRGISKTTARNWANHLDGVANFLSELRRDLELHGHVTVYPGKDDPRARRLKLTPDLEKLVQERGPRC